MTKGIPSNDEIREQIRSWQREYRGRIHDLRDQYEARLPKARGVGLRAESVLRKGVIDYDLKCEVTSRVKEFNSFRLKFRDKFRAYIREFDQCEIGSAKDYHESKIKRLLRDPFSDITDLIGIRCIGLFSSELYPFENRANQSIVSSKNSVSETLGNRPLNDFFILKEIITNRFDDSGKRGRSPSPKADEKLDRVSGYRAVHYDLTLKPESIVASLEQEFLDIPFELQVRTYSQHIVDDVSHFLSYKSDDIFFPAANFQEKTAAMQNELTRIQSEIDQLFEESRRQFSSLLIEARKGHADELLKLPISPDTLKLYAIFEFLILRTLEVDSLPSVEDAKFVELWLRELSDGLGFCGLKSISEVQKKTREGIRFVQQYAREDVSKKSIFKKNDLTDLLSKCLLFSVDELREIYPVLEETRTQINKFKQNIAAP